MQSKFISFILCLLTNLKHLISKIFSLYPKITYLLFLEGDMYLKKINFIITTLLVDISIKLARSYLTVYILAFA